MPAAPIHLAGERLMLDPAGAVVWPATGMLVVSDLHLKTGPAVARGSTRATLDRLALLLRRHRPRIVVALGDTFRDRHGAGRLQPAEQTRLRAMTAAHRFVWVQGHHDGPPPDGIGGQWLDTFVTNSLQFRHVAIDDATPGEISGHHHPEVTAPAQGGPITRACFVADARRIVLPAFGSYAGGLDVRGPAITRLFPQGGRIFLLGKERLLSFSLPQARAW